ncbi:MAG TPA: guanylate kinase [Parachlamydiales bacterium]|nr:guanylate kinase [Parachlamydiales bacterium]
MSAKILGGLKKGLIFVISAPAGTGKTTLVRMLQKEFSCLVESVSYTTRKPRPGEQEGVDYYFISESTFTQKLQEGDFVEHAKVFDHYYGTSRSFLESQLQQGKHVLLVIDTQGAVQLKNHYDAIFIFISPPSIEELRSRLYGRKTDTDQSIEHRLSWAEKEMALAPRYDYHIVNEDLYTAYTVLRSILIAEEHKNR